MGSWAKATLVIEHVFMFPGGECPAIRVIPHDDEGNKPRGKAGDGTLIVASEGESWADVLRTVAGYYEQEGSWNAFAEIKPSS